MSQSSAPTTTSGLPQTGDDDLPENQTDSDAPLPSDSDPDEGGDETGGQPSEATIEDPKEKKSARRVPRFRAPMTVTTDRAPLSHKPHGLVYLLIRWPILLFVSLVIGLEIIAYTLVRWIVASYEMAYRGRSRRPLGSARTYRQWQAAATELDTKNGTDKWRSIDHDPFYDSDLISSLTDSLGQRMEKRDTAGLVRDLVEGCKNNLGGIENEQLYSYTHSGTKHLVEEHVSTVCEALEFLAESPDIKNKAEIFRKLGKSYGRTALCLSGGASFGYYHLGVIRALIENGVMPKVISGTSAGALISSFVGVRTDQELLGLLNPTLYERFQANDEPFFIVLTRFLRQGVLFDLPRWEKKMQVHITKGNTTFLEAYRLTGRILNISVASEEKFSPPLLLNYKTTPNVVIWSAVLASAAVPGILHAVELQAKTADGSLEPYKMVGRRWRDGVLRADIPYAALKQLFGVSYTIVSQVNPHVVPFFFRNRGSGGDPTLHRGGRGWRGGFVFSMLEDFLRLDMRKWLQLLHNLNLLPRVFGQDWTMVFLQNFTGNVTIVPKFSLQDFFTVIIDPSYDRMGHYIQDGERNAWPKIAMIANRLKVEQTIERFRAKFPSKIEGDLSQSSSFLDVPGLE